MVNGFEIAPRNDKNWEYGQAKDVEVYLADNNGEWGKPVFAGRLKRQQEKQKIEFAAKPGRLFRFRILSTYDQNDDGDAQDAMVLTVNEAKNNAKAYNSLNPVVVTPITISEFSILEKPLPHLKKQQLFLSDVALQSKVARDFYLDQVAMPQAKKEKR